MKKQLQKQLEQKLFSVNERWKAREVLDFTWNFEAFELQDCTAVVRLLSPIYFATTKPVLLM